MTTRPLIGLGVLIFNNQNQLLLGKRNASHGNGSWAPPGGHLEFGESFEECATREILEELGLNITAPEFFGLTNDVFKEEGKHYISVFMKVSMPEGQEVQNLEPHKIEKLEWFDQDNLPTELFLPLKNLISKRGHIIEGKELFAATLETA